VICVGFLKSWGIGVIQTSLKGRQCDLFLKKHEQHIKSTKPPYNQYWALNKNIIMLFLIHFYLNYCQSTPEIFSSEINAH